MPARSRYPAKLSPRQFLYLLAAKDDYNGSNGPGIDADGLPQYPVLPPGVSDSGHRLDQASTFYAATPFEAGGSAGSQQAVAVRGLDAYSFETQSIPPGSQVGSNSSDYVFTERLGTPDLDALGGTTPGWLRFEHLVTRDFSYDATDGEFATAIPYDGERGSYVSLGKGIAFQRFPRVSVSTFLPLVATPEIP